MVVSRHQRRSQATELQPMALRGMSSKNGSTLRQTIEAGSAPS